MKAYKAKITALKRSESLIGDAARKIHSGVVKAPGDDAALSALPATIDDYPAYETPASDEEIILWRQAMVQLGYLRENDEFSGEIDASFLRGLRGLITDLKRLGRSDIAATNIPVERDDPVARQLLFAWLERHDDLLADLTEALGGVHNFNLFKDAPPRRGESGFRVRLLHAQLQRLGLYNEPAAAPYGEAGNTALQMLARDALSLSEDITVVTGAVREEATAKAANLAGHLQQLSKTVLDRRRPIRVDDKISGVYVFLDGAFGRSLLRKLKDVELSAKGRGTNRRERQRILEDLLHGSQNRLLARLLQMRLAQAGVYTGRIDGFLQKRSGDAITAMIENFKIDRDELLIKVQDDLIGVNFTRVTAFLEEYERAMTGADTAMDETRADEVANFYGKTQERFQNQAERGGGWLRRILRTGRRVFRTFKRVFRSAVIGIVRGLARIGDAVLKGIQVVRDFLRSVVEAGGGCYLLSCGQFDHGCISFYVAHFIQNQGKVLS